MQFHNIFTTLVQNKCHNCAGTPIHIEFEHVFKFVHVGIDGVVDFIHKQQIINQMIRVLYLLLIYTILLNDIST